MTQADEWLNDPEPVLVVDIDGDVRAYQIQILSLPFVSGRPTRLEYAGAGENRPYASGSYRRVLPPCGSERDRPQ